MPKVERFLCGFGKLAEGEKKLENEPHLEEVFAGIIENQIAGSPMLEKVRWTSLKDSQIVSLFGEKGHSISRFMVKQLTAARRISEPADEENKDCQRSSWAGRAVRADCSIESGLRGARIADVER